jgi:hypothetical protein
VLPRPASRVPLSVPGKVWRGHWAGAGTVCRRILTDPGCWGFRQYTLGNSASQEGETGVPGSGSVRSGEVQRAKATLRVRCR